MKREGHGQKIVKHLPYVHPFMYLSVCPFVMFYINLTSQSFIKISSPNLHGIFMARQRIILTRGLSKGWPDCKPFAKF